MTSSIIKQCKNCSSDFEYCFENRELCSPGCKHAWRIAQDAIRHLKSDWRPGDEVDCNECGTTFKSKHYAQRICSDACRSDRAKRKGTEYRAQNKDKINERARQLHWKNKEDRNAKSRARREDPVLREEINRKAREKWSDGGKIAKVTKLYNLTWDQAQELCSITKCEICGSDDSSLHIDHCHIENKVRGRLCNRCNNGIGRFQDDIELLKSAIVYLERGFYFE